MTFFSDYIDRSISALKLNLLQHVFTYEVHHPTTPPPAPELVLIK